MPSLISNCERSLPCAYLPALPLIVCCSCSLMHFISASSTHLCYGRQLIVDKFCSRRHLMKQYLVRIANILYGKRLVFFDLASFNEFQEALPEILFLLVIYSQFRIWKFFRQLKGKKRQWNISPSEICWIDQFCPSICLRFFYENANFTQVFQTIGYL